MTGPIRSPFLTCVNPVSYTHLSLKPAGLYKEILDEYLLTYTILTDKLNRLDQRIEELASKEEYTESVSKLTLSLIHIFVQLFPALEVRFLMPGSLLIHNSL